MGIALRQALQCQDNGLVKYWLEIVQETWICELPLLNTLVTEILLIQRKTPNRQTFYLFIKFKKSDGKKRSSFTRCEEVLPVEEGRNMYKQGSRESTDGSVSSDSGSV